MSTLLYRAVQPHRPMIALLVAFIALFVLGRAATPAAAQEDTSWSEKSLETVLQESTSGDGATGQSATRGDVKVGGGEAIAGDAYAGNGCARAGGITAGDCDEKVSGGRSGDGPSHDPARPEDGEEITETTAPESTVPETTSEETTLFEDTTEGETTSTASPAPDERGPCPPGPPKDVVEATIEETTDGDTLELAEEVGGYGTVRLIGVDAPELEGEDGQPEPLAEEASDFTAEELEGQEVLLQVGEEEADEYGRLLAYVWTSGTAEGGGMVGMGEAELFNLKLLEEGHAGVLTVEPNDLYAGCLEAAERDARAAGVGIWADDELPDEADGAQYDERTAPETTTEESPPPDTAPVANTPRQDAPREDAPEASPTPEEDPSRGATERQPSPAEAQYEQSQPESEIQEKEIRDPGAQEPEIQESVAPSGGDEAAVLESPSGLEPGASPAASGEGSASPGPAAALPAEAGPTGVVATLPETGGPSPLFLSLGLAGLLGGTAAGFLALRALLGRAHADGR